MVADSFRAAAATVCRLALVSLLTTSTALADGTDDTLSTLARYLADPADRHPPLHEQPFASTLLSKTEAAKAARMLWHDHVACIRAMRAAEMEARELTAGDLRMPFFYEIFGDKPDSGRSLYISLHGGGGAPKDVNDQQWENQKHLYRPDEGVYLAPRAPTDAWDLWHQAHIDGLFDRLIENLIVFEDVDPDRVYVMGYSAGGDGVYQVAPRMADRFAAAAMMAGHPNETSPLGLRNLPFAIHVGELDAAYNRNKVAGEWGEQLAELRCNDPEGYVHLVKLHAGKGHWMDGDDAEALLWMANFHRNPLPTRIVWKQDDIVQPRFYWLAVDPKDLAERAEVVASRDGQRFDVRSADVSRVTICLNDELADLDEPLTVTTGETVLFEGRVERTIATLARTLNERGDPRSVFSAEVTVKLPLPTH